MRVRVLMPAMVLGTLLSALGCHVQVDKGKNGEDKTVRIDTPLGGLHVRSDQTTAADLGLPVYPGAHVTPDRDGDKSADVHLGFRPVANAGAGGQLRHAGSQRQSDGFLQKRDGPLWRRD